MLPRIIRSALMRAWPRNSAANFFASESSMYRSPSSSLPPRSRMWAVAASKEPVSRMNCSTDMRRYAPLAGVAADGLVVLPVELARAEPARGGDVVERVERAHGRLVVAVGGPDFVRRGVA